MNLWIVTPHNKPPRSQIQLSGVSLVWRYLIFYLQRNLVIKVHMTSVCSSLCRTLSLIVISYYSCKSCCCISPRRQCILFSICHLTTYDYIVTSLYRRSAVMIAYHLVQFGSSRYFLCRNIQRSTCHVKFRRLEVKGSRNFLLFVMSNHLIKFDGYRILGS